MNETSKTHDETYVVSCSGPGAGVLLAFLYPEKTAKEREQYHLNTPDARQFIGQNKKFIYLFEDPRNALIALLEQQPPRPVSGKTGWLHWALRRIRHQIKRRLFFLTTFPTSWGRRLDRFLDSKRRFRFPLRRHFFAWFGAANHLPVTFVKFDTLWRHEAVLRQFLGRPDTPLPPVPDSSPNWEDQPPHIRDRLTEAYGRLAFRLTGFPDIFQRDGGLLASPIKGPRRLLVRGGGMFWTVNGVLRALLEVDEGRIDRFQIDDSVFLYGKWANFFLHPFDPKTTVQSENVAHYTTGFVQPRRGIPAVDRAGYPPDREQKSNNSLLLPPSNRPRAHRIIQKYLHLNPDLADQVAREAAQYAIPGKLALHMRGPGGLHGGTDWMLWKMGYKGVPYPEYFKAVDAYLDHHDVGIFVFSDARETIEKAVQRYGPRVSFRADSLITEKGEGHITGVESDKTTMGRDVVVESYLMAQARHLIHSNSNVTNFVLCLNPDLGHQDIFERFYQTG